MVDKAWVSPVLRWAGSKRKLLPTLMAFTPKHYNTYFEPFAGSACLFFALRPRAAILSDINKRLMQTYEVIKTHPRLVARQASSITVSKDEYYRIRLLVPDATDEVTCAAQFLYLNRYCFNGVYRTNRAGQFNVPLGSRTGSVPSEAHFYRCSVALRSANIITTDFEACLERVEQGDFVYLDPPYATSDGPHKGEYGPGCFLTHDIDRLIASLMAVDKRGAMFLLSYSNTPLLIQRLPSSWHTHTLSVYRHVSGFATFRGPVDEVLISNYPTGI